MSTTYPGAVDSYDTKVDNVDDVMAADINNPQDAIEALEQTLGPSGNVSLCEGRLTLATGVPVTTTDQTAKTTVYFTPYKGNRISLYDGSSGWDTLEFTEKSVAVPATTTTPFDVFAYNNGGTVALEALSWSNDTTRATALAYQDGIEVKTGATTRRYLGTCRTTGVSGQTEDSQANRLVWNRYNQVLRMLKKTDSSSHDYNTAAWRAWNNDATILYSFMVGILEDALNAELVSELIRDAGTDGYPSTQIYLNGSGIGNNTVLSISDPETIRHANAAIGYPRAGYNYVNVYEYAFAGATAPTFNLFTLMGMIRG